MFEKSIQLIGAFLLLVGFGQNVFAHTIIKNNLMSEVAGYSAVYTTHGCVAALPNALPIIAESTVIPTINPHLARTDGGAISSLGDFFTKAAGHSTSAQVPLTSLAGMFTLEQTRDVFTQQTQLHDAPVSGGNVIGWVSTRGNLHLNQFGGVPFRMSAISFKANSCARSLKIWFADSSHCDVSDFPSTATTPSHANAHYFWVDNTYLSFHGYPIEAGAATPVLTVTRDTSIVPYPANCQGAGGSDPLFDVTVKPSQEDVELLQFPGWGNSAPDASYYY